MAVEVDGLSARSVCGSATCGVAWRRVIINHRSTSSNVLFRESSYLQQIKRGLHHAHCINDTLRQQH